MILTSPVKTFSSPDFMNKYFPRLKHWLWVYLFLSLILGPSGSGVSHAGENDKILTLLFGAGTSTWSDNGDPTEIIYNGLLSINAPSLSFGKNGSNKIYISHRSFYESINKLVLVPEGILDYVASQHHILSFDFLKLMKKSSINIHFSGTTDLYQNRETQTWSKGLFNNGNIEASLNIERATRGTTIVEDRTVTEKIEFLNPETEDTQTFEYDFILNKGRMTPERIRYGVNYNYYDFYNSINMSEYFNLGYTADNDYNYHKFKLYFGIDNLYSPLISDAKTYDWQKKRSKIAEKKHNKLNKKIIKLKEKAEKEKGNKKNKIISQIEKYEDEIRELQEEFMNDFNSKSQKILAKLANTKYSLSYYYSLDYLLYPWQKITTETGGFSENTRDDLRNTVKANASYYFLPGKAGIFLDGSLLWNISGQNYYNTYYDFYIPDYYEYTQHEITAGIKTSSWKPMIPAISLSYTYRGTDYPGRYIPEDYLYTVNATLGVRNHLIRFKLELPISDNIFIYFTGINELFTVVVGDRRKYDDGYNVTITQDLDIGLMNYYFYAGLRF